MAVVGGHDNGGAPPVAGERNGGTVGCLKGAVLGTFGNKGFVIGKKIVGVVRLAASGGED